MDVPRVSESLLKYVPLIFLFLTIENQENGVSYLIYDQIKITDDYLLNTSDIDK